ncbi:MAG: glycosyltransferase family 4 protein [Deltaproteobacteria bacterium]|nr:glycosyltransferase family 4 protein [Deltaproteobacteria bacterium]
MGKTKIIHVITRFDKGGSSENTFLTVQGLDKGKYEVILIRGLAEESCMGTEEAAAVKRNLTEAEKSGVKVIIIPELVRSIRPLNDLKALFALIRIFKNEKPRIVHTHTSKAGILGRWAAFFAKTKIIVHTPHGHVFWGYFNKWKTECFIILERLSASITAKIITLTEQEKQDHLRFKIARDEKFTVIHSGVDLTAFSESRVNAPAMREKLGIPPEAFVVGTAGRLTSIKGQRYLLEAEALISPRKPDIFFVFLGDGELAPELSQMVSSLGIKNVMFLGWRQDVPGVMSTFDIFVLPSLNEGMGKVLVEAMALGKPIVASDVGGIPDLVTHNQNGLLVPPADVEGLAHSINVLLHDPIKRKEMGDRGKVVAADYSAEAMVQKIDRLYDEAIL